MLILNLRIKQTKGFFMTLMDLKKALALGVEFRFVFLAGHRFEYWVVTAYKLKDKDDKGVDIQAARGESRHFRSLDAAVAAVVRAGAPGFKVDRYQLLFDNPGGQKKGQLTIPEVF